MCISAGGKRVEGSEAKLLETKRLVSWSVCLDMTDWKVRIRWFELVVPLAPVPVAGLSQWICRDRLVTPPEIVFILIRTLVIRTHCSGCVRWVRNRGFEQLKLEKKGQPPVCVPHVLPCMTTPSHWTHWTHPS